MMVNKPKYFSIPAVAELHDFLIQRPALGRIHCLSACSHKLASLKIHVTRSLKFAALLPGLILALASGSRAQWTQVLEGDGRPYNYIQSIISDPYQMFASTAGGQIYRSTDNGESWAFMNDSAIIGGGGALSMVLVDSNLFAATWSHVIRSTDQGVSWALAENGLTGVSSWVLVTKPFSGALGGYDLFLGTVGSGVFLSSDYGGSWHAIDTGLTSPWVRSLLVRGKTLFAGTAKGVFMSTDNGAMWHSAGMPYYTGTIYALAASGYYLYAGYESNGVYRTSDDGATWTVASTGMTKINIRGLLAFGSNVVATTLEGGVFLSTNRGTSWTAINDGLPELNTYSLALRGQYVFVGTADYGLWRRSLKDLNIKETWKMASLPVSIADARPWNAFPDAISGAFAYSGGSYRPADTVVNGPGYWVRYSSDSPSAARGTPILDDTIDVQEGWNMIGSIDTVIPISSILSIPGGMVLSEFFTFDSGYVTVDSIKPGEGYWVKTNAAGKLILTAFPGAVPSNRIIIIPTGEKPPPAPEVGAAEERTTPREFSLLQNYPNPFNPTTVIRYSLPEASQTKLTIFNLLGQPIITLFNGEAQAGDHSVGWNAEGIPSGVYFCRLDASGLAGRGSAYSETRKLLLMR